MLIHDNAFVIADVARTKIALQEALIMCDRLLAADHADAVRMLDAASGDGAVDHAKQAWQFIRSAKAKRRVQKRQLKEGVQ